MDCEGRSQLPAILESLFWLNKEKHTQDVGSPGSREKACCACLECMKSMPKCQYTKSFLNIKGKLADVGI